MQKRKLLRLKIPQGKNSLTAREYLELSQEKLKRSNKYNNKVTWIDGIRFDSKKEADYYCELQIKLKAGLIKGFERQKKYDLLACTKVNGKTFRKKYYIADFVVTNNDDSIEVIDTKGVRTKTYQLKKHLMLEKYGIVIIEK